MNLKKIKKIHLIGVGGIGVSAIARLMLDLGKEVSGSDLVESETVKELEGQGLIFHLGHKRENISPEVDLVVYSPAVPINNPERQEAWKLDIPELSYPQMLGELGDNKKVIAISGTNGKTTTTAMIGSILAEAQLDPLVIVGSKVKNFKEGNLRFGRGEYFVVEACEYRANMLSLNPWTIVLTNIEEDHLDYFRNLDHIIEIFQQYLDKLPRDGFLIFNNDDPVSRDRLKKLKGRSISYGLKNQADLVAKNIRVAEGRQYFDLVYRGKKISEQFSLQIPGLFNIYNALAASASALKLGISPAIIQRALEKFAGSWRRFEKVGERDGAIIISDYAHHPTAIQGTIQAAKEFYPTRRLVVVFQPHQHNRTKKLFDRFVSSFDQADLVILPEIFEVAGREAAEDQSVSSRDLVEALKGRGLKQVFYARDLAEAKELVLKNLSPSDLILLMGAGDIYKLKL